ncbi:putative monocarboxylate transporter [Zygosaccharomyces mellis]|uniref:Putative monocarboxylate transporter n=1 Tax=Zygosaccharomyces mellis TaxID=42258 RepID=A0A4C2E703_9SACH|nr:putative monocarboxylate transporter [Zygosaccharomyces mellis]
MKPREIVLGPARALFKKRSSNNVRDVEMQEWTDADYKSSGYLSNISPADSLSNRNNDEIKGYDEGLSQVRSKFEEESEEDEEISEFPDGGLQAWLAVLGAFVGLVPVFGMLNSVGAIESYISKHQLKDVRPSTVSWIFSLYLAFSFLSCIFSGGYFDRNGSTTPMVTGTVVYVGGLFALANCYKTYQFILALSLCSGIGTGILMTPLVSVVATWFNKKRGIATSVATMGGSVGGVIFPIMLRRLYEEVGYPWAIRILAFLFLACLLFSLKFAHEREKPVAKPFESKREMVQWYASASLNWKYFLEWRFLFTALAASLAECSLTASATYLTSYALARGYSQSMSYYLITANNGLGILGRFVPAYLADKCLGRFNVSIITIGLAAFFNFVIWLPFGGHSGAIWAYVCLYGFATGSILTLTPVCIGQISSTHDFGKRYATAYFLQAILTIPVLPIGGVIVGNGSIANYNKFIVYVSVLMAAGAGCYLISRNICVGFRFAKF